MSCALRTKARRGVLNEQRDQIMKRKNECWIDETGELKGGKVKREAQVSKPGTGMEVPLGRIRYGLASRRYRHGSNKRRS